MIVKFFKRKSLIYKAISHFKRVCKHKYYVFLYCVKAGIPLQGILHDFSKFHPVEFFEGIRYYEENISPISVCKQRNGVSYAWLHHKGRNKHHFEYWVDNLDEGSTCRPDQMPFKYALELVCDYLGASHAYMGKKFTYCDEWKWWLNKRKLVFPFMNGKTYQFVNSMMYQICFREDISYLNNKKAKRLYYAIQVLDDSIDPTVEIITI